MHAKVLEVLAGFEEDRLAGTNHIDRLAGLAHINECPGARTME